LRPLPQARPRQPSLAVQPTSSTPNAAGMSRPKTAR
jgi:hypothetical protein